MASENPPNAEGELSDILSKVKVSEEGSSPNVEQEKNDVQQTNGDDEQTENNQPTSDGVLIWLLYF